MNEERNRKQREALQRLKQNPVKYQKFLQAARKRLLKWKLHHPERRDVGLLYQRRYWAENRDRKLSERKLWLRSNPHWQRDYIRSRPDTRIKALARLKLNRAVKSGKIKRNLCEDCGSTKVQGEIIPLTQDVGWVTIRLAAKGHTLARNTFRNNFCCICPLIPLSSSIAVGYSYGGTCLDGRGQSTRSAKALLPNDF